MSTLQTGCIKKRTPSTPFLMSQKFLLRNLPDLARWVDIGAHFRHDAMMKKWGFR